MRFYYYKGDNKKEIRKIDRDNICKDINEKATIWSKDIEEVREDYDRVVREIYPSANEYKDQVKMIPDVYEQRQSLRANIFKATYQNYDGMFDIEGLDPVSHEDSALLKSALVYDCYKIDLQSTLDKILDDYMDKGEAAWFSHWTTKVERTREQEEFPVVLEDGTLDTVVENVAKDNIVYEGADIERIDPLNLYFDKSQKTHWEQCGKIYREFVPLSYILNNADYKLTRDEIAELKDMVSKQQNKQVSDYTEDYHDIDTKVIGSTVEVMEYYGDYIIPTTGDVARNVIIVVIAGKYLAKLDESLYPCCPIGYTAYNERPDSLRGQTPLKPALLLNELENRCMDLTMESWLLTVNPPMLAQKGFINSGITYEPGGVVEYSLDELNDSRPPQPLNFSAGLRGFDFQDFFKRKMEGATGVSPYMQGTGGTGGVRTASESTYIYSGQTTRLSREAYLFSHNVIVPIIWAIYKLKKEYQITNDIVPVVKDGIKDFYEVTERARLGNYVFMIGNAQTSVEREQSVMKLFQLLGAPSFQSIVQRPEFPAGDFFLWVLNEMNYRQINTLAPTLGIRQAIRQEANARGIPEGKVGQYVGDMERGIQAAIPEFANMLEQQQSEGQIPSPSETVEQVREDMV